jgi:hypothetical protein
MVNNELISEIICCEKHDIQTGDCDGEDAAFDHQEPAFGGECPHLYGCLESMPRTELSPNLG